MSAILSLEDFQRAYPTYNIDVTNSFVIPEDSKVTQGALYEMVQALSLELIKCRRSVLIEKECSKYPFVYEILKYLVRYCDSHYTLKDHEKVPDDEEVELVAEEFVRNSGDQILSEGPVDMIMRWERHFKSLRGPQGSFGFVEFCVELERMVKLLVEVKMELNFSNLNLASCEGFYQACAELARAHQENILTADSLVKHAHFVAQGKVAAAEPPPPSERAARAKQREDIRLAGLAASEKVLSDRAEARKKAEEQPIYLALTDFSSWVFLQLDKTTITASKIFTPFPPSSTTDFSGGPQLLPMLQFLSYGLGVQSADASTLRNRTAEIAEHDINLARDILLNVYSDGKTYIKATSRMPNATMESMKAAFLEEYPDSAALWELLKPSSGAKV